MAKINLPKQADSKAIDQLQSNLGYKFSNLDLLVQALTHKSFAHENNIENNERFEFLGDAVLQFVMSDFLMDNYPELSEGNLSKFRAVLVSETGLSGLAKKIDLPDALLIGKGEEGTGGREKNSILADALEAVIASVYIDSKSQAGAGMVRLLIQDLFRETMVAAESTFSSVDYKTDLQEWVQKRKMGELAYVIVEESGPDHAKEFVTALNIAGVTYGMGKGRSKKISEQQAAVAALEKLKEGK